jgi:hypothetical protein
VTLSVIKAPGHGALGKVDQVAQTVRYTPAPTFSGRDSFTFRASNGTNFSTPAVARLLVLAPPRLAFVSSPTAVRNGVAVPVVCRAPAGSPCAGAHGVLTALRHHRRLTVGSKHFSVGVGQTRTVRILLTKQGKALLKRSGSLRLALKITLPANPANVLRASLKITKQ